MTRRQLVVLLATAAVVLPLVYLGLATDAGRGSALSRGPEGWLAARRYLEARGAEVRLLDRPPGAGGGEEAGGVLAEVFPWSPAAGFGARGIAALRRHVARGGDLVIAYSGGYEEREDAVLESLGLGLRPLRGEPPLAPAAWWRDARLTWRLLPEVPSPAGPGDAPAGVLELPAPRWAPRAPAGAEVLYRSPEELPVVFALRRGRGRIVVLPAVALANASLADAGNADLLEGLIGALGRRWAFDEYVHGLAAPAPAGGAGGPGLAFDLVIAHLAVLYLLAAAALGRRFGPAWREAPAAAGSTAAFLLRLGALHDRLGHHREAARKLIERWRELHPRMPPPEALGRDAEDADADRLVAIARALAGGRTGMLPADRSGATRSAILAGAAPAGSAAETRR